MLVVAIRFRWIWVEKEKVPSSVNPFFQVAIRFRWIWVEKCLRSRLVQRCCKVAIRFRWIWVEKYFIHLAQEFEKRSQSAFAGYGLKSTQLESVGFEAMSQSAFAGYGLKRITITATEVDGSGRNPLSLDMG